MTEFFEYILISLICSFALILISKKFLYNLIGKDKNYYEKTEQEENDKLLSKIIKEGKNIND